MIRRPPRSTRTDTLLPYTTLFRSLQPLDLLHARGDVAVVLAFLDAIETLRPAMLEQHADRRRAFGQVVRQAPHAAKGVVDEHRMIPGIEQHDAITDRVQGGMQRSEERRVGKECVSTCRSRCAPYH